MIVDRYFEDFAVGEERRTGGRTITEADIVLHAGQTGDFYPHHMDAEWCRTQPIGQRIAHGTLIFSVAIGMTAGVINPRAISYGYDQLRFVRPVHIGDTIRVIVRVSERRDHKSRSEAGIISETNTVLNQHDLVVLTCEHLSLVERRMAEAVG